MKCLGSDQDGWDSRVSSTLGNAGSLQDLEIFPAYWKSSKIWLVFLEIFGCETTEHCTHVVWKALIMLIYKILEIVTFTG